MTDFDSIPLRLNAYARHMFDIGSDWTEGFNAGIDNENIWSCNNSTDMNVGYVAAKNCDIEAFSIPGFYGL